MVSIWTDRWRKISADEARCREAVGDGWPFHQCTRPAVVFREVEGKTYGFCKQHDPAAVEARHKARLDRWNAEWAARDAEIARAEQERLALEASKAALEKIAAGHNDPRTLAMETLAMFPGAVKEET